MTQDSALSTTFFSKQTLSAVASLSEKTKKYNNLQKYQNVGNLFFKRGIRVKPAYVDSPCGSGDSSYGIIYVCLFLP
jgi:hypothetical protein